MFWYQVHFFGNKMWNDLPNVKLKGSQSYIMNYIINYGPKLVAIIFKSMVPHGKKIKVENSIICHFLRS